jgi:hypothetical protein
MRPQQAPAAGAQMKAGMHGGGKSWIAGGDKNEAAGPAELCQLAAQCGAVWGGVVPENHTAKSRWQRADGGHRVGQADFIREQP